MNITSLVSIGLCVIIMALSVAMSLDMDTTVPIFVGAGLSAVVVGTWFGLK